MANTPHRRISVAEIERLYKEGNWGDRLNSCTKIAYYAKPTPLERGQALGTMTLGYKFKDHEGRYVALVFWYKHPDGSLSDPRPKRLLVDGTWLYV
jgi:hypothetical protein